MFLEEKLENLRKELEVLKLENIKLRDRIAVLECSKTYYPPREIPNWYGPYVAPPYTITCKA